MIKLMLFLTLCLCGVLFSYELFRQKCAEAQQARELSEGLTSMIALLKYSRPDVYELTRLSIGKRRPEFIFTPGDFQKKWCEASQSVKDPEARRLMMSAGEIIGTTDSETQSESLSLIRDDLRALSERLRINSEKSKRLYITLGVLFCAAVGIIMI